MKAGMKRNMENVEPKAIKKKEPLKADLIVMLLKQLTMILKQRTLKISRK